MKRKLKWEFTVEKIISTHSAELFNLFRFSSLPALAELLGLQDESSYGQLLRTMPRGLKD